MNTENIVNTLHPLERKVLPVLGKVNDLLDIEKETGLKEVEAMRALQWLQNKGIIKIEEEIKEIVDLDKNGKEYVKKGLPERRFLEKVKGREKSLSAIKKDTDLDNNELNVALGILQKRAAIFIKKEKELKIKILPNGEKLLERGFIEERFLQKGFPLNLKELLPEEMFAYEELKKRKDIIKKEVIKSKRAELTGLGKEILKQGIIVGDFIDVISPKVIKEGIWKKKQFRRYDIKINVPKISGGKRHFVNQAIREAKRIWLDLGFKEMTGPLLETSFWNFDALFVPQDHPARELQDTFYVKAPKYGKLPNKSVVLGVKRAHEKGVSKSKGWGYVWSEDDAKRNVLRTHTTSLSARTIAALKKEEMPAKFFSIGTIFRNETLSWKSLFEFHQTEGIVVDPEANFRHLIGYLKEFFKKMGFREVRVRPAYFPYTEPSVEVDVFHPVKKRWMELGGAGIFRPEVVEPLMGKPIPVLAWGLGLERTIMEYFKIEDIRDVYRNDMKQLKEIKIWR